MSAVFIVWCFCYNEWCYSSNKKKFARWAGAIGIALTGYVIVLVVTFAYFVPSLISFTTTAYCATPDASLTRQARLWERLSLVRLSVLLVLAMVLLTGLAKSRERRPAVATFKSA